MKFGVKTNNAKWIFNTETGEISCCGNNAAGNLPESLWRKTNGFTWTVGRYTRPFLWFFKKQEFTFMQVYHFWYKEELRQAERKFKESREVAEAMRRKVLTPRFAEIRTGFFPDGAGAPDYYEEKQAQEPHS